MTSKPWILLQLDTIGQRLSPAPDSLHYFPADTGTLRLLFRNITRIG